jgi:hypothetical protein
MKKTLFPVLLPALLMGQALNTQSLTFTWPLNLPEIGMSAGQVGAAGAVPLYYWIVVRFPGGAIAGAGGPVTARNTVGVAALAPGTPVVVNWSPVVGATGYDVIRQDAGGTFQSTGACVNCVVALNTALLTVSDQNPVGPGGNWPPAGLVTLRSHALTVGLDGISEAGPFMAGVLDGVPGRLVVSQGGLTDIHANSGVTFRLGAHGAGASVAEIIRASRGTYTAPVILNNADIVGSLIWQGYDGAVYQPLASITVGVDAAPGAGDMPGYLSFSTTPDASATPVERLRFNNAGVVTWKGLTTAGMGLPPVLVTYSATNQAAVIAAGNLLAAAPAGQYRTSAYLHTTIAEGGACTATVILGWTYNGGAKTKNLVAAHDLNVDEGASDNLTAINVDAGTNITREVTRAGACATGTSRYDLYITLERLL